MVLIDVESMSAAERRAVAAELVGLRTPVHVIPSRFDPVHGSITTPAIVDRVRNGDVAVAHDMLGRPFKLEGVIKRHDGARQDMSVVVRDERRHHRHPGARRLRGTCSRAWSVAGNGAADREGVEVIRMSW